MLELKLKTPHVIAMIYSAQFMVHEKVDCPYTKIEMIELANYLENKKKQTKKEYKIKVSEQQATMAWQFVNSVLHNEVVTNEQQLPSFFEVLETLADKLDGNDKMHVPPFQLIQGGK